MDYNEHLTAHRRMTILEQLNDAAAYTLHEVDIKTLLSTNGQAVSSDTLRSDLQWLHEQGLVLATRTSSIWIATLTAKGGDVQQGLSHVPGVAKPELK